MVDPPPPTCREGCVNGTVCMAIVMLMVVVMVVVGGERVNGVRVNTTIPFFPLSAVRMTIEQMVDGKYDAER